MLLLTLVALVLGLPARAAVVQDPFVPQAAAEVGAGYAAKVVASAMFVGERSLDSVLAGELAPVQPLEKLLFSLLKVSVDEERKRVTASLFGVSRTALYRPGFGCGLDLDGRVEPPIGDFERPGVDAAWPARSGDESAGFDREELERAVVAAFENPTAVTRAVVVVHAGRIVAERYAEGFGPTTRQAGWSMAKSVVNALVGIRVREGELVLDAPLGLAAWSAAGDPRQSITLLQALHMSTGLRWREGYVDITSDAPRMLFAEPGAGAYAARPPLADPAGERFAYSSGTTNAICLRLRESFENDSDYWSFPRDELFEKIGMDAVLELDPSGTFVGSSFLFATPRGWARFGQLYLNDGVWDGVRILPEGWVEQTTTPAPAARRGNYGLHFWLNRGPSDAPERRRFARLPTDAYWADGYEGQTLAMFPSQGLVVLRLGCTKVPGGWDVGEFLGEVFDAFVE